MRLSSLQIIEDTGHIQVIRLHQAVVPLATVIRQQLRPAPIDDLVRGRLSWRVRKRRQQAGVAPPTLHLSPPRPGAAPIDHPGLIVYRSRVALISFLLQRWRPGTQTPLCRLIDALSRPPRQRRVDRLAAVESYLKTLWEGDSLSDGGCLVDADELDLSGHDWDTWRDASGDHCCHVDARPLVLHRSPSGSHNPEWLVIQDADDPVLHLTGGQLHRYPCLDQVPVSVVRRFDADGLPLRDQPARNDDSAGVPLPEMVPRFTLTVPPAATQAGDGPCQITEPAWLLPASRIPDPHRLHGRLPHLRGADAAAVLARCTDGIFQPDCAPRQGPIGHPAPGSTLVGALPFSPRSQP